MAELHTAKALVDIYILFVIRFYLNPIKGVKRSFGTSWNNGNQMEVKRSVIIIQYIVQTGSIWQRLTVNNIQQAYLN